MLDFLKEKRYKISYVASSKSKILDTSFRWYDNKWLDVTMIKRTGNICELVDADYLGGHKLRLKFNDGLKGEIDLSDYVRKGLFRGLEDPKNFMQFGLIYGTIVWKQNDTELDIAPEYLYQKIYDAKKGRKKHGFSYFNASSWN